MGHVRQALALAEYLCARWPSASALVVASSPAGLTLKCPSYVELVKLPFIARVGPDNLAEPFISPTLPISAGALRDLRKEMLLTLVRHVRPDLLMVDYLPAGPNGELIPALQHLRVHSPSTRLVFTLRDILYETSLVRTGWVNPDVYDLLEHVYDRILVFGQQDIYDLVEHAALPPRAAGKVRYVGYLRRRVDAGAREHARTSLGLQTGRLVLVTVGAGGAGGELVLRCMLEALLLAPEPARFDCVLVCGPLITELDRLHLKALIGARPSVRFLDAVPDLTPFIAAADVVVSRAGYNTVCEILSFARPAVLIPLVALAGIGTSLEQLMRAEAMQRLGLVRMIRPDELAPNRLLAEVLGLLERPMTIPEVLNLNGLSAVATELEVLLESR